jgi:hypothetical protein
VGGVLFNAPSVRFRIDDQQPSAVEILEISAADFVLKSGAFIGHFD